MARSARAERRKQRSHSIRLPAIARAEWRKQRSHSIQLHTAIAQPTTRDGGCIMHPLLDLVGVLSINELVPIRCTASEYVQREGEKLSTGTNTSEIASLGQQEGWKK